MTATTCTVGPSAVTGERCGKPAVHTFGEHGQYGECAEHSTAHIGAGRSVSEYAVGDHVKVRRYGQVYDAVITRVGARGAAYATFTYGNGATRTVRV